MHIDRNFNVLVEPVQNLHQAIDREAAEIGMSDAGEIRGAGAGGFLSLSNCHAGFIQHIDDPGCQDRAQLLQLRVREV